MSKLAEKKQFFASRLLLWSQAINRQLPWKTQDPYTIWISEIILQQTQVKQGLPYYERFIKRFPTVYDLAQAPLDDVYNQWKGLGYYSRARHLHHAANTIVEQYGGKLPESVETLKKLKGIGDYTAAAIASFAYDVPVAVLDGNVHRVISRYFGIAKTLEKNTDKQLFQKYAEELVPQHGAGVHNQAMMDLGALICKPRMAACNQCPVQKYCQAYLQNKVSDLPPKKKKLIKKHRKFVYFYITNRTGEVLIRQRGEKDIWARLYELPGWEVLTDQEIRSSVKTLEKLGITLSMVTTDVKHQVIKHQLTHQTLYLQFFLVHCHEFYSDNTFHRVKRKNLTNFAFPKPIDSFIKKNQKSNLDDK